MEKVLLKVYNHKDYLTNVLVPLSMDYSKVIYLSHREYKNRQKYYLCKILANKNIISDFLVLKDDENDIKHLLDYYNLADIDIGSANYLSLFLFERCINTKCKIIYYDDLECVIKDYRSHKVITDKIYSLNIEEMVNLAGANLITNMHRAPDIKDTVNNHKIIRIVDSCLDRYSTFTNFISHIMQIIANHNKLSINLNDSEYKYIINNPIYKIVSNERVMWIEEKRLKFLNNLFLELFRNAGAWLESYLYIKIAESQKFDDVIMSAVIEFKDKEVRYPISCEIDVIALRDNHLALISCKSNKVSTDAINEIKVHNLVFGNNLSKPIICTIEDLNIKNPAIFKKAQELEVAIMDVTTFMNNAVILVLDKILNGTYKYEKVKN